MYVSSASTVISSWLVWFHLYPIHIHCVILKEISDIISFYQWFQLSLKGRDFKRNHNTTFVLKSSLILSNIQCSLLKCHNSLSIILFHPLWLIYLLVFTFSLICFPDSPFSLPCNLLKQTNKQTNRFYSFWLWILLTASLWYSWSDPWASLILVNC